MEKLCSEEHMGTVISVNFKTKTVIAHAFEADTNAREGTLREDVCFFERNDANKMAVLDALKRAKEIISSLALSPQDPNVLCRVQELRGSSLEDSCIILNSSTRTTWKTYSHYFLAVSVHFIHALRRMKMYGL